MGDLPLCPPGSASVNCHRRRALEALRLVGFDNLIREARRQRECSLCVGVIPIQKERVPGRLPDDVVLAVVREPKAVLREGSGARIW